MDAKKLTTVITSICALLFIVMTGPAYTASSTDSSNKTKSSTDTSVKKFSPDNKISTPKGTSNKKATIADSKSKTKNALSNQKGIAENNKKEIKSTSKKQSRSLAKKFSGKVNINRGTAQDLQQIPGIGPAKAKNIIDYRKQHGSFKSAEDLLNIKGIGKGTADKIKQYLVF